MARVQSLTITNAIFPGYFSLGKNIISKYGDIGAPLVSLHRPIISLTNYFIYEGILQQVENEYGSYVECNMEHKIWLRDEMRRHVRDAAVLFTTDGAGTYFLRCGIIPEVYATVDFGACETMHNLIQYLFLTFFKYLNVSFLVL